MSRLVYLPQVDSTNLWCKQHLSELADGDAVYSTSQTAGRGRLGRTWENAPGSALYYSVFIQSPLADQAALPLAASLAVSRALRQVFGAETQIKWPNDLLLGGKKLVGILCEGVSGGVICGIGTNLAQTRDFFEGAGLPHATSLLDGLGIRPDPQAASRLAEAYSREFAPGGPLENFRRQGMAPILDEYRSACINLGRKVTFDGGEGIATGLDEQGRLIVTTAAGEKHVFTGEVSVRGIYGHLE